MIEQLQNDELAERVGGRFRLCALIQRRLVQLMEGARPLLERQGRSDLELAIAEVLENKITLGHVTDQPEQDGSTPQLAGQSGAGPAP